MSKATGSSEAMADALRAAVEAAPEEERRRLREEIEAFSRRYDRSYAKIAEGASRTMLQRIFRGAEEGAEEDNGYTITRITGEPPHEYRVDVTVKGDTKVEAGRLYYWEHDVSENEYEARLTFVPKGEDPPEVDCPNGRWRSRHAAARAVARKARRRMERVREDVRSREYDAVTPWTVEEHDGDLWIRNARAGRVAVIPERATPLERKKAREDAQRIVRAVNDRW